MDTSPDFTEYEAKTSAFAALRAQIFPDNKRMLFEVLASAGDRRRHRGIRRLRRLRPDRGDNGIQRGQQRDRAAVETC